MSRLTDLSVIVRHLIEQHDVELRRGSVDVALVVFEAPRCDLEPDCFLYTYRWQESCSFGSGLPQSVFAVRYHHEATLDEIDAISGLAKISDEANRPERMPAYSAQY
jgi:hypothetical protein